MNGLARVVVGADLKADDTILFGAAGSQHQDGNVRACPDGPAHIESVGIGKHEIEDDRIEPAPCCGGKAPGGAGVVLQGHARTGEIDLHHPGEIPVVLDHQQVGHRCSWRSMCSTSVRRCSGVRTSATSARAVTRRLET